MLFTLAAGVTAPLVAPRAAGAMAEGARWRPLGRGIEYAAISVDRPASAGECGDGVLHAVRVDPAAARLRAVMASEHDRRTRTAGEWCRDFDLAVAINLGMFQTDYLSNVGYARDGDHVNHGRWVETYKAAVAFGPREAGVPAAAIVDLDEPGARDDLDRYETVVQNLRLVRAPGRNVWSRQERRWSEAALAQDGEGRLLFLFTRTPFTMWELNRILVEPPLRVVRAMHLEGGPEASLSIHAGGVDLDLCGSFETGFNEDDAVSAQWPIPNVLGVARAGGVEGPRE